MGDHFKSGYAQARKDRLMQGSAMVKARAAHGLKGHSQEFRDGYRAYSRGHCVTFRKEGFL